MKKYRLIFFSIIIACLLSACNLSTNQVQTAPSATPDISPQVTLLPTLTPLPTLPPTPLPAARVELGDQAFFNGDFVISNPVMPNEDGTGLLPYTGPALTIEGELNKLASNISLGRDVAGVHFRTDGDLGMALGEEYAITVLAELVRTYNEDFAGWTFNKFDGTPVLVSKDGVFFN